MMQEDFYPVADKILLDIHQIFIKDHKLESFEILPAVQFQNKSPIHFEEHSLAIESWCVPHVYLYAYKKIMEIREAKGKVRDVDKCNTLLIGVLLFNPDISSLWNMRKELILSGKLDPLFDLHLTSVIMTHKPKCADIFSYRKWILKCILQERQSDNNLIEKELEICEAAANRYSNNYHAWTHRLWCLSLSSNSVLQREWFATQRWTQNHVSDYSGFHYRQKLILSLLTYIHNTSFNIESISNITAQVENFNQGSKNFKILESIPLVLKILIFELDFISDLIDNFKGHEALWYHRRFVFNEFKNNLFSTNSSKIKWGFIENLSHSNSDGTPVQKTLKISCDVRDQISLILSMLELDFIQKCSIENEPSQMRCMVQHKNWLCKFSNFVFPCDIEK